MLKFFGCCFVENTKHYWTFLGLLKIRKLDKSRWKKNQLLTLLTCFRRSWDQRMSRFGEYRLWSEGCRCQEDNLMHKSRRRIENCLKLDLNIHNINSTSIQRSIRRISTYLTTRRWTRKLNADIQKIPLNITYRRRNESLSQGVKLRSYFFWDT